MKTTIELIKENAMYISLMHENIKENYEVQTCKIIINILFFEMIQAKKYINE